MLQKIESLDARDRYFPGSGEQSGGSRFVEQFDYGLELILDGLEERLGRSDS